jgi:hypothetical protein
MSISSSFDHSEIMELRLALRIDATELCKPQLRRRKAIPNP